MRIGIDARIFAHKNFGGISRSVFNVIQIWKEKYKGDEFYLFSYSDINIGNLPDNWHIVVKRSFVNTGVVWSRTVLPRLLKKYKIDAYWGTNYTLPPKIKGIHYFLTIYDLAIMHFKGIGKIKTELSLRLFGKSNCLKADKIIAISEATKKDIIDLWEIDERKIIVSYCGGPQIIDSYISKNEQNSICKNIRKLSNFFLFIGTIEPRKNIITIVHAFEKFCEETGEDAKLVICGKTGWRCESIYEAINHSIYKNNIILTGYVDDNEKCFLMKNAKAFLYPSLYEGFGIPILEAMEYDLPIITSDISSMPEVGGDAVLYLRNQTNSDELKNLMKKTYYLTDEEKNVLIKKMNGQSRKFSWDKNAEEIMRVICNVTSR